jgi:diguanylate cyclase (GGDEF)-like protein/PAS domain S-box-containing protein
MPNVGKRAVEALAIALVYIGTAQPGFLIAIAPGNVTVVWPPSGIALAAMLLLGYRAGAGVWLGSFLVNLLFFIFHDVLVATAIITAGSIATGSMLQAFLAAFLYRRMIGAQIPPGLTAVVKFMTIAALSCLVAATFGVSSLAFSSAIVRTSITDTWLTWWVGDLIGILTIAPVLLVVGYRARQGEGIRYLTFPSISGVTGLALFAGYNIWNLGDHAVAAYLGVSPAWLSWAVFVIGLLLATLLASHIEYYMGIEEALSESERRSRRQLLELETLYGTAPIGLALVDRDLRFLRINQKLAEIDGVPIDAHIGRTLREVVPGVADTIEPLYRRVIETGQPVLQFEIHGTTPAQPGIERDWVVDYYPMKEPGGSVHAVAAIVNEITGRKRAEEALRRGEKRFRDFAAAASDWFWETDAEHRFVWMSANVAALTGVPRESQYGKTRFELMAPGTDPALIETHRRVLEARQPFRDLEYVRRVPDGDIWLSTSGVPVFDDEGRFAGYRGVGREIGAKKRAEEALRLSEQRFRDFATSASDWLWETDAEHRFTWFSPNVKDLVGVPPEWHYGKTRREIMAPGVDPELIDAHWQALEAHVPFRDIEYLRRGPDGDIWSSASGVPIFDEAGRFKGYRGVGRSISDRKSVEAELAYLAHHDSLTTLANRHTLQKQLEQALSLAIRQQRLGALLLFDLDHFKEVNDAHGHLIGDELLRMVANRLRPTLRETDTFARFGGDEFAVVAFDVAAPAGAADLAQRLIELMAEPFRVGDGEVQIGVSIGVALFPEGSSDPDQLITRADRALYWAKHESRGQVRFYDLDLDAEMQRHKQLMWELRRALERNEFELYYQPQLDLATDRCSGVEALVRWRHPDRGLLAPAEFIPIADASGLSLALDAWVLREACRQARVWCDRGQPLRVAVNLSQAQLSDAGILATVEAILATTGASADSLELEITERFVMEGFSETTEHNLKALAAQEIELVLDDFGQGYSSLASLRTLPVSKIKIDRAFIAGIGRIEQDEALVGLIVTLGQKLNKRVLAEGVETERQLEFLRQAGCDEAQGYFIGRPAPAEEIVVARNWSHVAAARAVAP